MKFKILTLFPEMFDSFLSTSIIKRAISKKIVSIDVFNIRDYTKDKYGRVDTPPIGGGAGLIMKCQPIYDCLKKNSSKKSYKICLSPRGTKYDQQKAIQLSKQKEIVILCGHYEGIDERVYKYFDETISVGDYILTGGEIGAEILIDSISRLIKGVISDESIAEESFDNNLLEYPQYTEPYDFKKDKVPDILYSGNHEAIRKYRRKQSLLYTRKLRKDLFEKIALNNEDKKLLDESDSDKIPKWEEDAIKKGSKFTKNH